MKKLKYLSESEQNKVMEVCWDIIRTLSPQSVPVKNEDLENEKKEKFRLKLYTLIDDISKVYDRCPFEDDHKITTLISNARQSIYSAISIIDNNDY